MLAFLAHCLPLSKKIETQLLGFFLFFGKGSSRREEEVVAALSSEHIFQQLSMPKLTAKQAKKQQDNNNDARAFGPLFNKDLGQHILKNPLVAQGIVDKVHPPAPTIDLS